MARLQANWQMAILVLAGILLVGYVDYLTGTEIRIFPLYFLPLVLGAWHFGRSGGIVFSLIAAVVWAVSLYEAGRNYSADYIWGVNLVTQGSAFLVVTLLVAWLRDGLEREKALSRTDSLTGLANSRSFYEQAGAALSLCQRNLRPVTLAYIDLDNFKKVNDTLGHEKGDEILQKAAEVMVSSLRASDVIARIGGDEFVVLLPETGAEDAKVALEKLRSRMTMTPQFQVTAVSPSIGAVAYLQATAQLGDMLKAADELMYQSKAAGKNRLTIKVAG